MKFAGHCRESGHLLVRSKAGLHKARDAQVGVSDKRTNMVDVLVTHTGENVK